ncbi:hypothetical protein KFE25_001004 [Diacronema lutheri]|uniref:Uncharacterized protein n=1 Tax=Diacronema lutheri TaxID=2081491 RepID=A0A8J5X567_DIALT|nr:hypothetical protein KFE25_001004 [Diacronema lutheri]
MAAGARYAQPKVDDDGDGDDEPTADGLLADPCVRAVALTFACTLLAASFTLAGFALAARLRVPHARERRNVPLGCESTFRFRAAVGIVEWHAPLHAELELNVSYCSTPSYRPSGRCAAWHVLSARDLIPSHGELLHALLLTPDLEVFVHVHPHARHDGAASAPLRLDVRLPRAGAWAVAVDAMATAAIVARCHAEHRRGSRAAPADELARERGEGVPFEAVTRFDVPSPAARTRPPPPLARGALQAPIGVPGARALIAIAAAAPAASAVRVSADGAACCACAVRGDNISATTATATAAAIVPRPAACYVARLSAEAGGGGALPISRALRKGSCNRLRFEFARIGADGAVVPVRSLRPHLGAAAHLILARLNDARGAVVGSHLPPESVTHGHVMVADALREAAHGRALHVALDPAEARDPSLPRPPMLGAPDWQCGHVRTMGVDGAAKAVGGAHGAPERGSDDGGARSGAPSSPHASSDPPLPPSPLLDITAPRFGPHLAAWVDIRETGNFRLFVTVADAERSGEVLTAAFWLRVRSVRDALPNATEPGPTCAAAHTRAACDEQLPDEDGASGGDGAGAAIGGLCGAAGHAAEVRGFCALATAAASGSAVLHDPLEFADADAHVAPPVVERRRAFRRAGSVGLGAAALGACACICRCRRARACARRSSGAGGCAWRLGKARRKARISEGLSEMAPAAPSADIVRDG